MVAKKSSRRRRGSMGSRGTGRRVDFPEKVQEAVLVRSARRCALCYGLKGSLRSKSGQLAHVDRDRTNIALGNAAYLCLPHHDEYDTKPSQSKRFKPAELVAYRRRLYAAVRRGEHFTTKPGAVAAVSIPGDDRSPEAHDRAIFRGHENALPEESLVSLLTLINSDQYFEGELLDRCSAFARRAHLPSNHFVSSELQERVEAFADAVHALWVFVELKGSRREDGKRTAKHIHRQTPHHLKSDGVLYVEHISQLDPLTAAVSQSYSAYRKAVKQTLRM